jgi:hypothetical protein
MQDVICSWHRRWLSLQRREGTPCIDSMLSNLISLSFSSNQPTLGSFVDIVDRIVVRFTIIFNINIQREKEDDCTLTKKLINSMEV